MYLRYPWLRMARTGVYECTFHLWKFPVLSQASKPHKTFHHYCKQVLIVWKSQSYLKFKLYFLRLYWIWRTTDRETVLPDKLWDQKMHWLKCNCIHRLYIIVQSEYRFARLWYYLWRSSKKLESDSSSKLKLKPSWDGVRFAFFDTIYPVLNFSSLYNIN